MLAFLLLLTGSASSAQITVAQIEDLKNDALTRMEYHNLRFAGSAQPRKGYCLALAFGKQEQIYEISGTSRSGDKVSIPFSEIEYIKASGKEGDLMRFQIMRFPTLSPADLLRLKPNWSELNKDRRTIELLVPLRDAHGNRLVWIGSPSENGELENLGAVEATAIGESIVLSLPLNATWWAVPSVTSDPLCTPCQSLPALYGSAVIRKPEE
jgi:hypothetical protein